MAGTIAQEEAFTSEEAMSMIQDRLSLRACIEALAETTPIPLGHLEEAALAMMRGVDIFTWIVTCGAFLAQQHSADMRPARAMVSPSITLDPGWRPHGTAPGCDGLTAAECLAAYERDQREQHDPGRDVTSVTSLTAAQLRVARDLWQKRLREKCEETRRAEAGRAVSISCDDDRWDQ